MTVERYLVRSLLVAFAMCGAACTGAIDGAGIGETDPSMEETGAKGPAPGTNQPRNPSGGTGGTTGTEVMPPVATTPPATCGLLPRRLVKLTPAQIVNSLNALVPGAGADAAGLDGTIALARDEFSNSARRLELPESHVEALMTAAEKVATRVVDKMSGLAACLPAGIDDDACIKTFIDDFGSRTFRRPLETTEADAFLAFFKKEAAAYGRGAAVHQTVITFLVSPSFLFRTELGGGTGTSLLPHEKASALSYFLTDGPPDSALMMAANLGKLSTRAEIEAQARRILKSGASASRGLLQFFEETFQSEDVLGIAKDATLFPTFQSGSLATAMAREPMEFIQHVLWKDDANFSKLYTANYSIVNYKLAELYGVTAPADKTAWEKVTLPAGKRSGLLTQGGFLAKNASATRSDIVLRGKFIRTRLLCQVLPPPPMMVAIPAPVKGLTAREVLETVHSKDPACASCHALMDPLGFAFENYDAIGAWRDTEEGKPINGKGVMNGVKNGPIPFANALELGTVMGGLEEAQQCLLGQLYAYSSGQRYTDVDECRAAQLVTTLKNASGNILDAVAGIVASDDFFQRAN